MKKTWRHSKVPFFGEAPLHRFSYENGLRLFVLEQKTAPVFSYQTWYNVGSRDEEAGKSGLAHLFEHMMFKGTRKHPQGVFDRAMESAGARDLNAFTSTDYTAYVASLPVEYLELVAGHESDRMTGLSLTKDQFESEREVVRNERKQRTDNNPEGQMYEEIQKLAYSAHPYGRPVIGWEEDLDRMSTTDCDEFYRSHYAPNNAVICVTGCLKPEKVAAVVAKYYGAIPKSNLTESTPVAEPRQTSERLKIMPLPLQVEKIYVGYRVPPAIHGDHISLSVLSSILSTGRSSRLYRALVDKGVTIDASVSSGGSKDPALLYLSFTSQSGRKAEEALEIADREIEAIATGGVLDEELERARTKLRTEIHMSMTANSSLANFIGQNEIVMGDVSRGVEEVDKIMKVTSREVQEVARKYFQRDQRTIVIGRPA